LHHRHDLWPASTGLSSTDERETAPTVTSGDDALAELQLPPRAPTSRPTVALPEYYLEFGLQEYTNGFQHSPQANVPLGSVFTVECVAPFARVNSEHCERNVWLQPHFVWRSFTFIQARRYGSSYSWTSVWTAASIQFGCVGLYPSPDTTGVHGHATFLQKFSNVVVGER
jgi:hypothetical protein